MPDLTQRKSRPKYLDLPRIRLPLPGIVSFLHRVSGAGLFLLLPVLIYLLDASLASGPGYAHLRSALGNPLVKLALLVVMGAYLLHFCAGIRFLLLDMHVGVDLKPARGSAWLVLAAGLVVTLVLGVTLW